MFLYAAGGGGPAGQPSMLTALFPFIIIFVIFYFLIIMPARKKQKQHQSLVSSLKGGERVVTSGGIYGTVTRVMEDRVEIKVDKNATLQVAKQAISTIIPPEGQQSDKAK
jgi:preprotein translocase subunit YajC